MPQADVTASTTGTPSGDSGLPRTDSSGPPVSTGIAALDERTGGLVAGESYLVTGSPGPAKLVAALHFLDAGLAVGERTAVVTAATGEEFVRIADSWGVGLEDAWRDGRLVVTGFRNDFELRATRSVTPDDVLDELDEVLGPGLGRIVVDPGTLFLAGGARSLLGAAYLRWARRHPATVGTTFSLDGDGATLPASADWLLHATAGRLVVERRAGELYQITLVPSVPTGMGKVEPVSLMLAPGKGLRKPDHFPARRGEDRGAVDPDRLLLLVLGQESSGELAGWAEAGFRTTVVREILDAVDAVQEAGETDAGFGAVLVYGPRAHIQGATRAVRTLRPLTRAAMVFASDDDVRAQDRIHMLEAGADECLTGGIDLPELDLRLRQAALSGARTLPGEFRDGPPPGGSGNRGQVDGARFMAEVERRAARPVENVFSVVRIRTAPVDGEEMDRLLLAEIRDEDGDLFTDDAGGHLVLLQGARAHQARPFVDRVLGHFEGREGALTVDVLSHPADGPAIRALLEDAGGDSG